MRKLLTLVGVLSLLAFASCSSAPAAKQGKKPAAIPFDGTTQIVDITTGSAPIPAYFTFADDYSYVNAKNLEYFQFPLARDVSKGETLKIKLKGKNNGTTGFRAWLIDGQQVTLSNLYLDAIGPNLDEGDFDLEFELTAEGDVKFFFIKGPAYGTNIDNVDVSYIEIVYP